LMRNKLDVLLKPSQVVWGVLALCASVQAQQVAFTGGSYGAVSVEGGANAPTTAVVTANSSFSTLTMNSYTTYMSGENVSTVSGLLKTDGAALGFDLRPTAARALDTGSVFIQADSLYLNSGERIGLNLLGSLKNNASKDLIRANTLDPDTLALYNRTTSRPWPVTEAAGVSYTAGQLPSSDKISDNSYVIDSAVDLVGCGANCYALRYTATRAQDAYISKATGVAGHFSNNAALKLSQIAYNGVQSGDMVTVIDRLDINDYGFGNNGANLAVQSKRLAPIANNAYSMATLGFSDYMLSTTDDRLQTLRGAVAGQPKQPGSTFWAQGFSHSGRQSGFTYQSEFNTYDGYSTSLSGVTVGLDRPVQAGWVGASLSLSGADIYQQGFRSGDKATVNSMQLGLYGAQEYGATYLQGGLAWASHDLSGARATAIGRTAADKFTMNTSDARVGVGYRIRLADGKSVVAPFANLQYTRISQPARTETGAGDLNLQYEAKDYTRTRLQTGVRYTSESRLLGRPTYLNLMAGVSHDGGLGNMDVNAAFTGNTAVAGGLGFTTPTAPIDRTAFQLGAQTSIALTKTASLQFKLDLEHRRTYNAQGVQIKGLWLF
jgi:outer membrane autotransporter protein